MSKPRVTTDEQCMTTVGSLSEDRHSFDVMDEEVSVCLTRKQWRDVTGAILRLHLFHDDDGVDSRYNGEYEPIVEEIDSQLKTDGEDPYDQEEDDR